MSGHKMYAVWNQMIMRCTNKDDEKYPRYGGRGISVCKEWKCSFVRFYEDMHSSYQEGLETDRRDNDGNYCKENCRWVRRTINQANKRKIGQFLKGTGFDKRRLKFYSRIKIEGVVYWLGYFEKEEDAAFEYLKIHEEWYGR